MNTYQERLDRIVALYEQAIELAREEEREACIKIGDTVFINSYSRVYEVECTIKEYKEKIRARGGVKTDDETCPHCGAMTDAEYPNKYYGCGTHINDPTHRFGTCYERQLAAKDAEIEGLKIEWSDKLVTAVLNEREACAKLCDAYKNPNDPYEPVSQFNSGAYTTAEALADEIRARGEVK